MQHSPMTAQFAIWFITGSVGLSHVAGPEIFQLCLIGVDAEVQLIPFL